MNKFTQFLVNLAIGVVGFFAFALLGNALNQSFWVILIFGVIAAAGFFLMKNADKLLPLSIYTYMFTYGCIYAFMAFIRWISEHVLPSIEFNTFFKGLLLFLVSCIVFSFLAEFVKKGAKAIIAFKDWKDNPAWNFQTIAFGFLCLLGLMWWIAGIVECGIAGALSFLGIVLAFIPNDLLDALTEVPAPSESSQPQETYEQITLDDGTVITNKNGSWMDKNSHEWKQENGGWRDDGFRL